MAVDVTANPIIVPAADAGTTMLKPGTASERIVGVRWAYSGATAGTSAAVIQDVNSRVVWSALASGTAGTEESRVPFRTNGFKVPTLAFGTLYIYLGADDLNQ